MELDFSAPIGNGLENRPEDIIGVSKLLGRMGLLKFDKTKEPSSTISTRLVESLKDLQRENGLTPTGEFKPGDKTDAILKAEAVKILGSDPKASQSRDPRDPGKLREVAQLDNADEGSISLSSNRHVTNIVEEPARQTDLRINKEKSDTDLRQELLGLGDKLNDIREKLRKAKESLKTAKNELERVHGEAPHPVHLPSWLSKLMKLHPSRKLGQELGAAIISVIGAKKHEDRLVSHKDRVKSLEKIIDEWKQEIGDAEENDREINSQIKDIVRERERRAGGTQKNNNRR